MDEFAAKHERYKTLLRNVFSSGDGKELMTHFRRLFVDVRLYGTTDRDTAYAVAQRDLIMEIIEHANVSKLEQIEVEEDAIN